MSRGRLLAAFAAIYVIWGSTFLAVAVAVQTIPPFLMMGVRCEIGGVILLGDRLGGRGAAGAARHLGCAPRSRARCFSSAATG